jgi:DNA topoisomerase II
MMMTDQDHDGSHIKGLLINLIHFYWPNLLKQNFLKEFVTPIIKVTGGKDIHSFFTISDYEAWLHRQ